MTKKIFLIAGEASGDLLGSKIIKELKINFAQNNEAADFIGVGGRLMIEQGLSTIFPMEELSIMGFTEILPHIPKLLKLINKTALEILSQKPDFVITIDSPDFNFRVAKKISNYKDGKKIHLIALSVWAYRAKRAEKISKLYNLLLTILPFEPVYFEKYGLKTVFIGHPIVENIGFSENNFLDFKENLNQEFRKKYQIKDDQILIAITPGSRNGEVKRIFPEFIKAINLISQKRKNIVVIIPLVEKTKKLVIKMASNFSVKFIFVDIEEKQKAFCASNFALAKSGTNAVEFSLYQVPIIVAYKVNFISFLLFKMMVKIRFANLINLILNKEIIPEMLQFKCCGKKIANQLEKMINDKDFSKKQITESLSVLKILGLNSTENPSKKAVKEILAI